MLLNSQEKRLAIEITIIALIMSMGVASMIYSNSIRLQLDVYTWTLNGTDIPPAFQKEFDGYKEQILAEVIFGLVFIFGGFVYLARMYLKNKN